MLFCTQAYAQFFAVIFTTYWLLAWRPARALMFVVACTYVTAQLKITFGPFVNIPSWYEFQDCFGQIEPLTWLMAMVVVATTIAELRGVDRGRVWLLLLASYYFYACWNKWLAALILVSSTGDYFLARGIEATSSQRLRKSLLALNIVGNLGLLVYFKYANFFLASLTQSLQSVGVNRPMPVLEVLLPIGISFYTFEAINYVADVYRGKNRAERNLANFVLFITFFPHLVAGPIVRARDFLPQMQRHKHFSWVRIEVGLRLFLLGLFKKLALADRMAEFVDPVFANPHAFSTTACWMAVIAYAIQIYGDFSGYSDMATGSAHLLGYRLADNFNSPYLAANPSDFWRRWHISLSTWLRDYLFIPLGGSHCSPWRTRFNLLATMALGGLWHGANWTFVIWGLLHGSWLIGHREFKAFCERRPTLDYLLQTPIGTLGRIAATLLGVLVCWVFFRASTFDCAWEILQRMFVHHPGLKPSMARGGLSAAIAVVVLGHFLSETPLARWLVRRTPAPVLGAAYAVALSITLTLAPPSDARAFIYFQF